MANPREAHHRLARRALLLLTFAVGVTGTAFAQTTGTIEGVVRDATGGALPGATAQATSASLQGVRVAASGKDGRFRFQAVPPGSYTVKVDLPGFRPSEKVALVALDATATADFVLEPEVQEQIAVTGEAPLVDTTATTTGTTYTSAVVTRLPVSRNYADIVRANPGVIEDNGDKQGRSTSLSIYGSTSAEHLWIIDGVNTTNVVKGIQGKAINNEFVEEVEVKTGGYQAEYGHAIGGVINVITKSGGNTFHGDGFVYYDSDALQAEREFVPGVDSDLTGMRVASYTRADYGFDLGGYVLKDRLWFFAAYDRVSNPSTISPYVAGPLVSTSDRFPLDKTDNLYSGKLTWNIASSSTLVGSVFADPTTSTGASNADPNLNGQPITNPDPGTWESDRSIGAVDFGLRLNRLLGSSGLVIVQGGRHQDKYSLVPTGPSLQTQIQDFRCEGGTPEQMCPAPQQPLSVHGGIGQIFGPIDHSQSHRDQVRMDGSFYLGAHEAKAGAEYQDGETDAVSAYSGGQLVGLYNEYGQTYYQHQFFSESPTDLTPVDWPSKAITRDLGIYAQDSWRVLANLTINAGLRFDREWIINFQNVATIKTDSWQPRIGVVWDPLGDGTSKVYASAGRYAYSIPTDLALRVYGGFFYATTYNFDQVSVTPDPNVLHHPFVPPQGNSFGEPVDPHLKPIVQDELTLGVEKTLAAGTLSIGLKGTYRRLTNTIEDRCDLDYNYPESEGSTCALVNPGGSGPFAQGQFHYCSGLDQFTNCNPDAYQPLFDAPPVPSASRIYRGIELLARKTLSQQLWLQASYVYSSLIGNFDGEVNPNTGQTDPGIQADFDYYEFQPNNYGRLFLDRPHQARVDGYYVTPFLLSIGVSAWVRSGAPLNQFGYFNGGYGSYIFLQPRGSAGRLPAEWDANLTLGYPIRVGPVTVTLQAYAFNLFNNQIRTNQDEAWTINQPNDYPSTLHDPSQPSDNSNIGKITQRSKPRLFRGAIRVSF